MLPDDLAASINTDVWPKLPVFDILQKYGQLKTQDMNHIFNMGLGMVISVDPSKENEVLDRLNEFETVAVTIGEVVPKEQENLVLRGDKL